MKLKRWFVIGLWLMLMTPVLAQLKHGDAAIRVVGYDFVNMRSEPRVSDETLMTKMPRGTVMKKLEKRGEWYQVLLSDGRKAWMSGRYAEEIIARDLLEVAKAAVNVRGQANAAARRIATVKRGEMLQMLRERSGWYQIRLASGKQGWVRKDMVVKRPLSLPAPKKVAKVEPKSPPPKKTEPPKINQYKEAKIMLAENRLDDAIKSFKAALKERPNDGLIHFDLAKVYKTTGNKEAALVHFRRAAAFGKQTEATFYINELLAAPPDTTQGEGDLGDDVVEGDAESWDIVGVLLPALTVGSGVFIVVLGFVFMRRRRNMQPEKPPYRRRKKDAGFESVLKYAVEKRPLLRAIEEAERKRDELDSALQERFNTFQGSEGGERLPSGTSSDALLKKVDDLRQVILNQEERAQIYSDLIVLQNEKLDALDEEIAALKKMIQIDYRDEDKKTPSGKRAAG